MTHLHDRMKHLASRPLHAYADWRVGATAAEKHCHKDSASVLLTFDDYGSAAEVSEILDILHRKHVKAMFFLQGDWASRHPELVAAIARGGHMLGNHTTTHPVLLTLNDEQVRREIAGGLPGPWFRPPEGRYDKRVRRIAAEMGYTICYWTIDSRDWTGATGNTMRHTIMSELEAGAVILFHLHGRYTRDALPLIIDDIRARGHELTAPDENWQP